MGASPALRVKSLRPRVKTALRLYVSGAMTQKDAARTAGIHPQYLVMLKRNPLVRQYINDLERQIDAGTVNMSAAIAELGRRGLAKIARLMDGAESEMIQFKAAQDLADRSPETAKTNKLSVEGDLTIQHGDAQALMQALVEAAKATQTYAGEVSQGDYVKVDDGVAPPKLLGPGEP
jgi:hypothetical protein